MALSGALATPEPAAAMEKGWYRIGFEQRIRTADREALDEAGARAVQYVPDDAYVALLDASAHRRVAALAAVNRVRPLSLSEKISDALDGEADSPLLGVLTHGSALDNLTGTLMDMGWEVTSVHPRPVGEVVELRVRGTGRSVGPVAELSQVLHVGPASPGLAPLDEVGGQIVAGNLSPENRPLPGFEAWLEEMDLSGAGVRVSVVDTGISPLHPDVAERIVGREDYGLLPTGEPVDVNGHGTHVAGIVAGDASGGSPLTRFRDDDGFLYGLGVAPEAELVDQNAIASTAAPTCQFWPPSYPWERLTRDALSHWAGIWNASWWSCEDSRGSYIESARAMDVLVRDGDPATSDADPFTMVFAAGNFGAGLQTISSPSAAKNVITVGSTQNRGAGGIDQISGFSSRGPAADGRILPTIVAPGGAVTSARAVEGAATVPPGCLPLIDPAVIYYTTCAGTSMAAPHVTGGVVLLTEWWRKERGSDPSPAMTKALLVNSARPIARASSGAKLAIPNPHEGWGRLDLGELLDPTVERVLVDQAVILQNVEETYEVRLRATDPSQPLKATLAWTDAPGAAGASPALVNDLDLRLRAEGGSAYHGNNFSDVWSVPGGAHPDRLNNLENIFIEIPGTSTYTLSVTAFNLPGDGVPGGSLTDQDFALVVSNAVVIDEG